MRRKIALTLAFALMLSLALSMTAYASTLPADGTPVASPSSSTGLVEGTAINVTLTSAFSNFAGAKITYTINGETVGKSDLIAESAVAKIDLPRMMERLLHRWFG